MKKPFAKTIKLDSWENCGCWSFRVLLILQSSILLISWLAFACLVHAIMVRALIHRNQKVCWSGSAWSWRYDGYPGYFVTEHGHMFWCVLKDVVVLGPSVQVKMHPVILEFENVVLGESQRVETLCGLRRIIPNVLRSTCPSGHFFSRRIMVRKSKIFEDGRFPSDSIVPISNIYPWRRAAILPERIEGNPTHLGTVSWLRHDLGIETIEAHESSLHRLQRFPVDAVRFEHRAVLASSVACVESGDADKGDRTRCLNPYRCFSELAAALLLAALSVWFFVYGGAAIKLRWWRRGICWIGWLACVALCWRIIHFALAYHCWFG